MSDGDGKMYYLKQELEEEVDPERMIIGTLIVLVTLKQLWGSGNWGEIPFPERKREKKREAREGRATEERTERPVPYLNCTGKYTTPREAFKKPPDETCPI